MKAYRGIRGVTPRVLILVSRWLVVNGQRHVLAALHPRNETDVCGPYGRSGRGWRRENLVPVLGFKLQIVQRMAGV